jgi:hypothetical protein
MTILQIIKNHFELFEQTILNQAWIRTKIISFSTDFRTRWMLCAIILYLNFRVYYFTPQRYSKKKKCFWIFPIKCSTKYLIIFSLIVIINFAFMYYLWKQNPLYELSEYRLKLMFVIITMIFLFILENIFLNTEHIVKNKKDTFNPPTKVCSLKSRIITSLLLIGLLLYQFSIEYILGSTGPAPEFHTNYILNKFMGFKETFADKIIFFSGWSKAIEIIIHLILLVITILYYPCKYNLPRSWNY